MIASRCASCWTGWARVALVAGLLVTLAACSSGPVRRISEPDARLQQLIVAADGSWTAQVRIENYSSIPMRFDSFSLALETAGEAAGTLQAQPALTIGPESADVVDVQLTPAVAAKLAVADALAAGRSVSYSLKGSITTMPDAASKARNFDIERRSALSPAPGLPGVLR
ncbi:NDR1/HIN1-like protein [Marilutibacter alkalisoli]|uniref:LEA type 2 family protein n=1 Tax=Marilutibacter alkalisoli TaxID=2591633 RepID=A0A514BPY2_9GAMM|nr:LEA type 2 family protein [Lysobacter alkalisoli]QDH69452.1 LEA type 2 family protein [Lysobacter alkalisoli]